jgi:glycosyltransferase involved in cell wall biosynthesis
MRVLITGEILANCATGVEQYTLQLVRALVRQNDVDVTVLVPTAKAAECLPEGVHRVIHKPLAGTFAPAYWAFPPKGLQRFDLIHCPTARTPFLRKPAGVKLVMTIHDLVPLATPNYHKPSYRTYFTAVLPHLLRQCDMLIVDSNATHADLARFFDVPSHMVRTIPAAGRWPANGHEPVAEPERYLLAVGTLEPRKNLARVLRAFVQVKKQLPELPDRLLIAGRPGWGNVEGELLLKNRQDISWLGYVPDDDLKELYRKAQALVYPSLYEGFGMPVLEAMNLGCPVITSDRSSLPEVAGNAALYVDPESVESIALAMRRILTQSFLRRELSELGFQQAAKFSWERCAAETVEVYQHVLATPTTGDPPSTPARPRGARKKPGATAAAEPRPATRE